ncbi:hypothetical protein DYH55_05325 [Methylovirgula sp. 4M-Z18]|nr:hypothetical protein DYH55_05325 [Methylovirgula sp. 4M-Z18]
MGLAASSAIFTASASAQSLFPGQPDRPDIGNVQYNCERGWHPDPWGRCVPSRHLHDVIVITPDGRWRDARESGRYDAPRYRREDAGDEGYDREEPDNLPRYRRMPDTDDQY